MVPVKNILMRRAVILSLIGFGLFITVSVLFVNRNIRKADAENRHAVELAGKMLNELNAIYLCTLPGSDTTSSESMLPLVLNLQDSLNELKNLYFENIEDSDSLLSSLYSHYFRDSETILNILVRDSEVGWNAENIRENIDILRNHFGHLQALLPGHLLAGSAKYRREIQALIIMNLLILLLAGFFIIRLSGQLVQAERSMVRNTIEVENRERERIAADLHDGLGSLLSGLIIHLQILEKEYEHDPELKEKIQHLNILSHSALQSIEEVINNLNPSMLSRIGLVRSLEKISLKMNELGKIRYSVDASRLQLELPKSTELVLYRICTELMNNAYRHSGAEKADFVFFSNKKQLHLVYRDNGVGFPSGIKVYEDRKSGLFNIVRRVESLGGTCRIQSEPDHGVEIEIIIDVD